VAVNPIDHCRALMADDLADLDWMHSSPDRPYDVAVAKQVWVDAAPDSRGGRQIPISCGMPDSVKGSPSLPSVLLSAPNVAVRLERSH
jgi:hypothetical protein